MRLFVPAVKLLILLAGLSAFSMPVLAEDYPSRTIKLVVPFPPGGSSDYMGRVVANGLKDELGETAIIENKGGAGTLLGTEAVARADPDGYTLLATATPFAINATLVKTVNFDTVKSFDPVIFTGSIPLVLLVNEKSPWRSLKDLVEAAKAKPGVYTYGSSGNGGSPHLATSMIEAATGIKLVHIPYKGSAPAVADLVAGQTDLVIDTVFLGAPHVKSGRLRALVQLGAQRSILLPDVPTMQELGYKDFSAVSWFGIFAPAGTPRPILQKLNVAINRTLAKPEIAETLKAQGFFIDGGPLDGAMPRLKREIEIWGKAVRDSGAVAQ